MENNERGLQSRMLISQEIGKTSQAHANMLCKVNILEFPDVPEVLHDVV